MKAGDPIFAMQASITKEQRVNVAVRKAAEAILDLFAALRDGSDIGTSGNVQPALSETYLSVEQLSQRIPYSKQSIYNMVHTGIFVEGWHFTRKHGRPIFFWSRVEEWLRSPDRLDDRVATDGHGPTKDRPEGPFIPAHRSQRVSRSKRVRNDAAPEREEGPSLH